MIIKARIAPGRRRRSWLRRGVAGLLALLAAALVMLTALSPANAQSDEEETQGAMSFYALASSTATFLGNSLAPDFEGPRDEMWRPITENGGSGGSMLGYSDKNRNDGGNWLTSSWTAASHTMSYSALSTEVGSGSTADRLPGLNTYAEFGAANAGLGLDKTKSGMSLGFVATAMGGIIYLLFAASHGINTVFAGAISWLQALNPFKLFFGAINAINPTFANGMVGGDTTGLPTALQGLASWIAGWYGVLYAMSWSALVPIFLGVLVVSLLMFKKMDKGSAVKKFVVRLMFIGLGLPLLGSMYTGTLNAIEGEIGEGNPNATSVVLSTFVDFENWAMRSNLYIPSTANISWDPSKSRPGDTSLVRVRDTAKAINTNSTPGIQASWYDYIPDGGATVNKNRFDATLDLISRYMAGDTIKASDYETKVVAQMSNALTAAGNAEEVTAWFKIFDGKSATELNTPETAHGTFTLSQVLGNHGVMKVIEGYGLRSSVTSPVQFSSGESSEKCYTGAAPSTCNLAPLAMYNYLNTTFGSEAFTVYSAEKSTSEATREVHMSVNVVGTGLMSGMFWFSAVTMLFSFVVIGAAYMLGMMFASFRRTFQLMAAVPFATLGALAGIAKVIVYAFALIIEILLTVFLYMVVQEFIMSIPQIMEAPFQLWLGGTGGDYGADPGTWAEQALNSQGSGVGILTGSAVVVVSILLSTIAVIGFTVLALRVRKSLVKAVEEAVTKITNKFLETNVGAPGGGSLMPALAGAAGGAAGGAAMAKMLGGNAGKDGSKGAGGTSGVNPAGPGGGGPGLDGPDDKDNSGPDGPDDKDSGDRDKAGSSSMSMSTSLQGGDDEDRGRDLAVRGDLSDPSKKDGTEGAGAGVGDGAIDDVAASTESSMKAYAEADKAKLDAGVETGKAAYHGAKAAAHGAAGDAAGAVSEAAKTADHLGKAQDSASKSAELEKSAGESDIKPGEGPDGAGAAGAVGAAGLAADATGRPEGDPASKTALGAGGTTASGGAKKSTVGKKAGASVIEKKPTAGSATTPEGARKRTAGGQGPTGDPRKAVAGGGRRGAGATGTPSTSSTGTGRGAPKVSRPGSAAGLGKAGAGAAQVAGGAATLAGGAATAAGGGANLAAAAAKAGSPTIAPKVGLGAGAPGAAAAAQAAGAGSVGSGAGAGSGVPIGGVSGSAGTSGGQGAPAGAITSQSVGGAAAPQAAPGTTAADTARQAAPAAGGQAPAPASTGGSTPAPQVVEEVEVVGSPAPVSAGGGSSAPAGGGAAPAAQAGEAVLAAPAAPVQAGPVQDRYVDLPDAPAAGAAAPVAGAVAAAAPSVAAAGVVGGSPKATAQGAPSQAPVQGAVPTAQQQVPQGAMAPSAAPITQVPGQQAPAPASGGTQQVRAQQAPAAPAAPAPQAPVQQGPTAKQAMRAAAVAGAAQVIANQAGDGPGGQAARAAAGQASVVAGGAVYQAQSQRQAAPQVPQAPATTRLPGQVAPVQVGTPVTSQAAPAPRRSAGPVGGQVQGAASQQAPQAQARPRRAAVSPAQQALSQGAPAQAPRTAQGSVPAPAAQPTRTGSGSSTTRLPGQQLPTQQGAASQQVQQPAPQQPRRARRVVQQPQAPVAPAEQGQVPAAPVTPRAPQPGAAAAPRQAPAAPSAQPEQGRARIRNIFRRRPAAPPAEGPRDLAGGGTQQPRRLPGDPAGGGGEDA